MAESSRIDCCSCFNGCLLAKKLAISCHLGLLLISHIKQDTLIGELCWRCPLARNGQIFCGLALFHFNLCDYSCTVANICKAWVNPGSSVTAGGPTVQIGKRVREEWLTADAMCPGDRDDTPCEIGQGTLQRSWRFHRLASALPMQPAVTLRICNKVIHSDMCEDL